MTWLGDAGQLDVAFAPPDDAAVPRIVAGSLPAGSSLGPFDAIVTDPPYGLMEGLGAQFMPLAERVDSLLDLARRHLRLLFPAFVSFGAFSSQARLP